jgi:hypothetical protein
VTAAAVAWLLALAQDVAGAPADAQAALGGLLVGSLAAVSWGLVAELQLRSQRRRARAAERLSRSLFAAAGARRRRYRLP